MFHNSVHKLSERFLAEQRRHYYVTPTSYLELLGSYKSLLGRRQVWQDPCSLCSFDCLSVLPVSWHTIAALSCNSPLLLKLLSHATMQDEVLLAKRRYEIGLEKLQTTEESVSGMKEELIALQPQLEVRTISLGTYFENMPHSPHFCLASPA